MWLRPLIYIVKSYDFFPFKEPFINLLSRVYHFNAVRALGLHLHQRAMLGRTRKQELKYGGLFACHSVLCIISRRGYKECLLTSPQVWREEQPACRAQAVVGLPGAVGARVGQEQDLLLQQAPRSLRDLFSWN